MNSIRIFLSYFLSRRSVIQLRRSRATSPREAFYAAIDALDPFFAEDTGDERTGWSEVPNDGPIPRNSTT
jgi:hypothetical protein